MNNDIIDVEKSTKCEVSQQSEHKLYSNFDVHIFLRSRHKNGQAGRIQNYVHEQQTRLLCGRYGYGKCCHEVEKKAEISIDSYGVCWRDKSGQGK